ncbi:hypothetical protein H2200_006067 [Cladophialophora chaetospira]|uniref:Uncharacterized protein n=1 Tax=Cladophialophora chaetospira TaxID=386627 RepID=A0AA38XA92_9EURO|nr:hypothetical protein H2200_006067 [Cladophialophora chaetospira]
MSNKTGSKKRGPQQELGQLVSLQLHCSTTEPFYAQSDSAQSSESSSSTTMLSFSDLPQDCFSAFKEYLEKHGYREGSMKSYAIPVAVAAFAVVCWLVFSTTYHGFDPLKVLEQGRSITSRSWEFGTLAEALLEYHDPALTVFDAEAFPSGSIPTVPDPSQVASLAFAKSVIWTNNTDLLTDGEGSAADPASLGTAAVLLSYHDRSYLEAARRQAEYLLTKGKRFRINATHSAISHREDIPELWGDFIYMVPPFLAYYGVATKDIGYLEAAVAQCQLYSDVLSTNIALEDGQSCRGLWRHIVSDPPNLEPGVCCTDPDVWLTSSAWAVAGMTRVLATITHWQPPPKSSLSQPEYIKFQATSRTTLINLIASMLQCTRNQARDEGSDLLKNYLDGVSHQSAAWAYGDAAGTALMAAAVYRLAVLLPETYGVPLWLKWADQSRRAVARHIDENGVVSPVADVGHVPSKSPAKRTSEGQSMVVLMFSAWRNCVDAGVCRRDGGLVQDILQRLTLW